MAALMCIDLDLESDSTEGEVEPEGNHENGTEGNVLEILEQEMNRLKGRESDAAAWLELEELGIDNEMLCSLDLSSKFPNLVALNLWGNKLQNVETVVQEITKCTRLRAVWLNENPVILKCGEDIEQAILNGIPRLEIYNSHVTSNFSEWELGFCGGIVGSENPCFPSCTTDLLKDITTLDLSNRCIHWLPQAFTPTAMPSPSHLNLRGNQLNETSVGDLLELLSGFTFLKELGGIFTNLATFFLVKMETKDNTAFPIKYVALQIDIPGPIGSSAVKILEYHPNISILNGVNRSSIIEHGKHVIDSALQPCLPQWTYNGPLEERIIGAMWLYLMTYRLADEEKIDETSVLYVCNQDLHYFCLV